MGVLNGVKRGCILEGWVDSESVAHLRVEFILGGRGRFWEGDINSGSVAYSCRKGGYIPERWGGFSEPHLL